MKKKNLICESKISEPFTFVESPAPKLFSLEPTPDPEDMVYSTNPIETMNDKTELDYEWTVILTYCTVSVVKPVGAGTFGSEPEPVWRFGYGSTLDKTEEILNDLLFVWVNID